MEEDTLSYNKELQFDLRTIPELKAFGSHGYEVFSDFSLNSVEGSFRAGTSGSP